MRLGKFILLFQAVATLIIGISFLSMVVSINDFKIPEIKIDTTSRDSPEEVSEKIKEIEKKYLIAAYILLIISLMEIVIISRLVS